MNGRISIPRLITAVSVDRQSVGILRQALPEYQGITEFSRLVLSGPEGSTNGWYLGAAGDYVIVVVVEGEVVRFGEKDRTKGGNGRAPQ